METLTVLDVIGAAIGLVYLYLEYKASIYLWIVGIIMPAIYIFTFYKAGLYADVGMNVYYLLAAVYGWITWNLGKKHRQQDEEMPITRTAVKYILPCLIIFLLLWLLEAWTLIRFTNSTVPWMDAFVNALSVIGMWMLARKYVEQWLVWILVDVCSCGLYIYKGLPFTSTLYGLYVIIAIFGYFKWLRMMKENGKSM
jgi:nicotinamide mononucleotide transporter